MGKSIGKIKDERGIGGAPVLHGSDVPKTVSVITVVCRELREAPANFKSPAILDFVSPIYEKGAWPVNLTNLKALAIFGMGLDESEVEAADFDDIARAVQGKSITLSIALVNNPTTHTMVRGLFVTGVEAPKQAKGKPKQAKDKKK